MVKLTCNIDQRGRKARLVGGGIVGLGGIAVVLTGLFIDSKEALIAGILLCVAGLFMIFEGVRGWCVVRALGIRTPL